MNEDEIQLIEQAQDLLKRIRSRFFSTSEVDEVDELVNGLAELVREARWNDARSYLRETQGHAQCGGH